MGLGRSSGVQESGVAEWEDDERRRAHRPTGNQSCCRLEPDESSIDRPESRLAILQLLNFFTERLPF
jgi:hypothetical protein